MMKKIYALLMLCLPMLGFAQKDVTFIVDMRDYSGSYTTVNLNGDFNSWCGTCNPMADADGDSIWTVTLPLTADSIEYKFTLDGWTGQENLTSGSACTKTTGIYTNRFAAFTGDTILPGVAWESCDAKAGQVYLTMQVNMSYQAVDSTGVFLAGGGNFGNPGDNEMHPIGDSIYSITVAKDTGFTSFFTFTNGACPSWGCKENLAGKPCGDPNNYNDRSTGSPLYGDFHLKTCFGECTTDGTCPVPPTPVNVTFQSDRSNSPSFTTAYLSGTMNGWSGNANQMLDPDGDDVYTVTLSLLPGTYEYKYSADNWTTQENFDPSTADSTCTLTTGIFTNRIVTIGQSDTTLPVQPWEECAGSGGSASPTSVNVSFSVDMNQLNATYTNVYVSGTFDNWSGTSNQLSDSDSDGVFIGTLSLQPGSYQYKFNYDGWSGIENLDSVQDSSCTVVSGIYTNRALTVGNSDTTLPNVCFEECFTCITLNSSCNELFFSEYAEGSSNHKYFEIYNPSINPVSLSNYTIYLSGNGGSFTNSYSPTDSIAAGDVYVVSTNQADNTILSEADTAMAFPSVAHFNGDDALILVKGTDTIDVIGTPGIDPGSSWVVDTGSTRNHTLIRKASVATGQTDWSLGALEWEVYPQNTWSLIGGHVSNCSNVVNLMSSTANEATALQACSGDTVQLTFDINSAFASSNYFTVEISKNQANTTGSPVWNGTLIQNFLLNAYQVDTNYNITLVYPDTLSQGLYSIRIIASSPSIVCHTISNIIIGETPPVNYLFEGNHAHYAWGGYGTFKSCETDTLLVIAKYGGSLSNTNNTWQWYKNGQPLVGQVNDSLILSGSNDEGIYKVSLSTNLCDNDAESFEFDLFEFTGSINTTNNVFSYPNYLEINADGGSNYEWYANKPVFIDEWNNDSILVGLSADSTTLFADIEYGFGCIATESILLRDTTSIDTLSITVYDTNFVDVYDTSFIDVFDTLYVTVIDTVNLTVTDTLIIDVSLIGLNPLTFDYQVLVYPNPTTDYIYVDIPNAMANQSYFLELINPLGQVVHFSQLNQLQTQISINSLGATGSYILRLKDSGLGTVDTRVIILQ